jgi:putative transposase
MKRSRFSDEQIIRILNEHRSGKTTKEICAEHNLSNATFYNWKRRFGDMDVQEARKQRALEEENARMKRIIADQAMQIDILKEINSKKW